MKIRLIAVLLLLVFALAACASEVDPSKPGKDPKDISPSANMTEETEDIPEIDTGLIDGNTYKNVDLAASASFPEEWYLYNETDLAALNNLAEVTFDRVAIADAVNEGQEVVIFCASEPSTISSVQISTSKNPLPGANIDALVNHFAPLVKEQYEQNSALQNLSCNPFDTDFCGQELNSLVIKGDANGMQLYETILYLPSGNLLYTLTVSTTQADMTADILGYFTAIN